MTGYNLSHLTMAPESPEVPRPIVRPPKSCRGCGGPRPPYKHWCAACHAARYPVQPPILTQDWAMVAVPVAVPVQIAHCGQWHTVDGLPMRLPCCGMVLGEGT